MISIQEMRLLEERAFASGASIDSLMESAGKACAHEIEKRLGRGKKIAVFVGAGNNGGDGLVAARYLKEKNDVTVVIVKELKTDAARKNLERAKEANLKFADIEDADIIIDAMLGIGTIGTLRGEIKETCKKINQMKGFKVAIDIPTGVDSNVGKCDEDAIKADATICLHDCKKGCEKSAGELWIVDIGL
jgi:ADP-dependent NAD(P)H-hydrate dehydratase / NAD(P)H-hydrate epimerase